MTAGVEDRGWRIIAVVSLLTLVSASVLLWIPSAPSLADVCVVLYVWYD